MSDHTPSQQQRNGEHVLYCFNDDAITYGSRVNASDLKFDIVLQADKVVRLINPSSDPRLSWQRIRNHCHIDWGDGHVTKWYARVINSGRFNRDSEFIPQHVYKNANVGDRFTITVKCREPLVPIYCRLEKMWGEFPEDIYRVKSSRDADDDMGLFGECYHIDYPELSLLNKHRDTVHTVGADLLVNWRNTDMTNMFSHFIALREVPVGFFRILMGNVLSYENCFAGCDSLEKVDVALLGLGNNVVRILDSMFEGCLSLKNTIYLQSSESLISVKSMYKDCRKLNVCDERLFNYCPNIIHADRLFMNDGMLSSLGPKILKFSFNMETISEACMKTGLTQTYISIGKMNKLYDARKMYYNCRKLATITDGFFQHTGINATQTVDFDDIFCRAGDLTNGCVVPSKLCQPIGNISKLKAYNVHWFYNFSWRGNDFPADLFRDTFKNGPNRKEFTIKDMVSYAVFPNAETVELKNAIFTGNQNNLVIARDLFAGMGEVSDIGEDHDDWSITKFHKELTYFNRDMFINMPNLLEATRAFADCKISFKFYEDLFKENKKLYSFIRMFDNVIYKFYKFPIDYIVRTTSDDSDVNMEDMYRNSNIRVYRPIHWSATRNVRYRMNGIVANQEKEVSVPVEFMLDGRTQVDPDYSHDYYPRGIVYIYQSNSANNYTVTLKIESGLKPDGTPMETHLTPAEIDWGDGTTEFWSPRSTSETKSHKYSGGGCTKIVIKSDKTPYFIKQLDQIGAEDERYPVLEVRGEYPYGSFDGYDPKRGGMTCFMAYKYLDQSVYRIAHSDGTLFMGSFFIGVEDNHPYILKYASNETKPGCILNPYQLPEIWSSTRVAVSSSPTIYPRFYENCVSMRTAETMLNISQLYIPDDIFPKTLLHSEPVDMKFMGGQFRENKVARHKLHLKTSMYRDWMTKNIENLNQSELFLSYPVIPYNSAWSGKLPYANPLYEKLSFVVRDITINNLGLERLSAGIIGEVKIEIFSDDSITDKTVVISNDADLVGCIGDITGKLNVINVYSRVPLWLDNHNIINEVRGVIPECNLNRTFKNLAPSVTRISRSLFYRLTNRSFDNMFKDCTKLEQIPDKLFLCNTKANSFVSCFENCTSLDRVPDYLLTCYDHDIDCSNMFKGCAGIKHVYRPISDSVLGRVKVNDMFKGCKTTAFELNKDMSEQALDGVWYIGNAGLEKADLTPHWQRATVEIPTLFTNFHYNTSSGYNTVVKEVLDVDIEKAAASIYLGDPINTFDKSTKIAKPRELGKAFGYRFRHIHFTYLHNISMRDFCEVTRYAIDMPSIQAGGSTTDLNINKNRVFSDEVLVLSPDFLFWNETLNDLYGMFEGHILYIPFHGSFLKMTENLKSISRLFYGTKFKHYYDIDVDGVLGKSPLDNAYLGAKIRTCRLNFDNLFDRNIELLNDLNKTFDSTRANFRDDRFKLGECNPTVLTRTFANSYMNVDQQDDKNFKVIYAYPLTLETLENTLSNANLGRHGDYEFAIDTQEMLYKNPNIINDDGLIKKLCGFKHVHSEIDTDLEHPVAGLYKHCENLSEVPEDCFSTLDPAVPVKLSGVFMDTGITKLPKINHLVYLANATNLFEMCDKIKNPIIPENYIKSDYQGKEVLLERMFALSNARVENQFIDITSTARFNVIASLEYCISTIGDDPDIFLGINYNRDPANRSLVNYTGDIKNAFKQVIKTLSDNVSVHIDYFGDHTSSIKQVNNMEISWGDGTVNEKYNGTVDFAVLRHTYAKAGIYRVQIRCNEFTTYVETAKPSNNDKITVRVGKFVHGDADLMFNKNENHTLEWCFGNYVEEYEDNPFENLTNTGLVTKFYGFSNHHKLKRIPKDVLKPFTNLEDVDSTFYANESLESIPDGLFKYNPKLKIVRDTFGKCSKLTSIPAKLFENNPSIEIIERAFFEDIELTSESIPLDLFKPITNLKEVIDPWKGCTEIVVKNDDRWNNMFKYNKNITKINSISSAGVLESIPVNILSGLTKLTNIDGLFGFSKEYSNNSDRDKSINLTSELIDNSAGNIVSMSKIFSYRLNIKSVSGDFLDNAPKINNLSGAFEYTKISNILPKYIINDRHTSSIIDCSGMFEGCTSARVSDELISQHATRTIITNDMLKDVRSYYCEPEIFTGVHPQDGVYNSGYAWDAVPLDMNVVFSHESPLGYYVDDFRLFPFYEWQKTNFEPVYIEKITITVSTRGKNPTTVGKREIVYKKVFKTLDELLSGTVVNAKRISEEIGTRPNHSAVISVYTNKPLRFQYIDPNNKNCSRFWIGVSGLVRITKTNPYDEVKWSFENMTKNDENTLFDLDEGSIFSGQSILMDKVTNYVTAGFKYLQYRHYLLYYDLNFKNIINIDNYLADTSYWNVAIRPTDEDGNPYDRYPAILPLFNNMPNIKYANKVFKNTYLSNYGGDLMNYKDHPSIVRWQPFEHNHKIEQFGYMYYNTNIPKIFKLNFDAPEGVSSITHMFAKSKMSYDIPYDYFNGLVKLKPTDLVDDYDVSYHNGFFMDWIFGRGSKQTTLKDKTNGKMLMSEWRPDFDSGINIFISGLFDGSLIPTEERLEFIDKLPLIHEYKHKRIKKLHFDHVEFINSDYSGDVTPYLRNGKLLDLSNVNCEAITLENFLMSVTKNDKCAALTNIPAGCVILPDNATDINITNMFKDCTAHPSVTNIADVFVYNGSADIDFQSCGLRLSN